MKDYREVAENVFRRRDEYEAKEAARIRCFQRITASLSIFAISIAFLFTIGTCYVFAVGLGILEDHLGIYDKYFNVAITEEQQDAIRNAVVPLGETVTSNGVSVTAQSVFTDGTTAFILLKIEAPEQVDLNGNGIHFNIDERGILRGDNPNKPLGAGDTVTAQIPIDDQDGAKNTQEILLQVSTTSLSNNGFSFADGYDRYIILNGLYAHESVFPFAEHQISNGKWSFRVRFDDTFSNTEKEMLDCPVNLPVCRVMCDVQQTAKVHSIVVKGLSVIFRYTYGTAAVQEPGDFGDVKIVLTDGTVIDVRESIGVPGNDGEFVTTFLAVTPILVEDIDYIQIGETIIFGYQTTRQGSPMIPQPEE